MPQKPGKVLHSQGHFCGLCPHDCCLQPGQLGLCKVRRGGIDRVESLVYGRVVAEHVDPIEKKPLYHVLPGSLTYSLATLGCNLRCRHCQNSTISQVPTGADPSRSGVYRPPDEVVVRALAAGCQTISYTYVEPTVFFDYAFDCAVAAREVGLGNIFVSNGYMSEKVIRELAPLLLAINIDLKAYSDDFYRRICGGRLAPVLAAIRLFHELGVWVEVTTLLIPGLNDSPDELQQLALFLAAIDRELVWHVTGFHPAYRLQDVPPTPLATLELAVEIGRQSGLYHVYTGNRPGRGWEDSRCAGCGRTLISRRGFMLTANDLLDGRCPGCSMALAGRW